MSLKLVDTHENTMVGLNTYTYTIPVTQTYTIQVRSTVLPPSGLVIVINKNGSPIATSATPLAAQQVLNLQVDSKCTAADAITVVLTSSAASDNMLNTLKSSIIISPKFTS